MEDDIQQQLLAHQYGAAFELLINPLSAQGLGGATQNLLLAVAAGRVFLAIGLAAAFPRPFRQFWSLI